MPAVVSHLSKSFNAEVMELSAQRYGDQLRRVTESGGLRMTRTGMLTTTAAGTTVRRHTFHGQHADPRG